MNLKHLLPKILTTILATLVTFVFSPSENKAVLAANTQADHQSNLEGRLAKVREMISLQRIIDEKPQTLDKSVKMGGQAIAQRKDELDNWGNDWRKWTNWGNQGSNPQANR